MFCQFFSILLCLCLNSPYHPGGMCQQSENTCTHSTEPCQIERDSVATGTIEDETGEGGATRCEDYSQPVGDRDQPGQIVRTEIAPQQAGNQWYTGPGKNAQGEHNDEDYSRPRCPY